MHAAFCIAPFSGHVNPSLAVVSELARRGHRVSFATTMQHAGAARGAGADPVVYRAPHPAAERGLPGPAPRSRAGHDLASSLAGQLRELTAVLPELTSAFAADRPDVVVCDPMCWSGRALAAACHAPAVSSVTTLISEPRWSLGTIGASFDPADPRLPRLLAAASATLARHGAGLTADQLLSASAGMPVIAYHPRAFEPRGGEFGPDVHFVGPCLGSRPGRGEGGGDWRPAGDGPVAVVSLGTVFNRRPELFRRCAEALAGLGCQVVLALGGLAPTTLGPLPPGVQAHAHLPLPAALKHAAVFVGHAGMTSTMEALSLGVPIVALPQIPEQCGNARRLAELGLGACLEGDAQSAEAVRRAAAALLNDQHARARLAWIRAEIDGAPGAPGAAGAVEDASRRRGAGVAPLGTASRGGAETDAQA